VFKALNGLAPPYLVDDCNLVSDDIRRLRSAVSFTCAVPRTRTRLGDRSFTVAGPQVWNCLPAALRVVEDYEQFKKLLKSHLFDWAAAPSYVLLLGPVYKLTLLLLMLADSSLAAVLLTASSSFCSQKDRFQLTAGDLFAVSVAGQDLVLHHHGGSHQTSVAALRVQWVQPAQGSVQQQAMMLQDDVSTA